MICAQTVDGDEQYTASGALRTGFTWAASHGFKRAIQVDADMQHDPAFIGDLVAEAESTDAGLVIGSRFGDDGYQMGRLRRFVSKRLSSWVSKKVGTPLTDVTSGFRAVSQPLLGEFGASYPAEYLGDTVEAVLIAHDSGAGIAEVPVRMQARAAGKAVSPLAASGYLARVLMAVIIGKRRG